MDYLGFLPGSFSPHWDDEPLRRPRYHELLKAGALPAGYAADAKVGLHFVNAELQEVVACNAGSGAYRLEVRDGEVLEEPIEARVL